MTKFPVLNKDGKESEGIEIPKDIFTDRINKAVIHQAVVMYQASLRQGNASTKDRSSISGGGKKPWRQKGTGRARAGSTRSPLWKKGGVVFGPHPRDFGYDVPQKIKRAALRESLNAKYQKKELLCIEDLKEPFQKTKDFSKTLDAFNVKGNKILAVLDGSDASVARVSRNIPHFNLMRSQDVNANDILKHRKILLTRTAFRNILDRIKK